MLLDNTGTISAVDGTVTVQGTGSLTGNASNWGIYATCATCAIKTTGAGDVNVTGTGGGSGASNFGILLLSGATISVVDGTATVQADGSTAGRGQQCRHLYLKR